MNSEFISVKPLSKETLNELSAMGCQFECANKPRKMDTYNYFQTCISFDNGYGASIIDDNCGMRPWRIKDSDVPEYEIAVLDKDGYITFDTPITDEVARHLTEDEVVEICQEISNL